jgi:N-[(2S)-2-amino-2-carboxyethyl]-L-glutamate dehydrogenase
MVNTTEVVSPDEVKCFSCTGWFTKGTGSYCKKCDEWKCAHCNSCMCSLKHSETKQAIHALFDTYQRFFKTRNIKNITGDKPLLYLSEDDVRRCGGDKTDFYMDTIMDVFKAHFNKEFSQPKGTYLRIGDYDSERTTGRIISLPGYIGGTFNSWGMKWVASKPSNLVKCNLPRANALVVLNDLETGKPIAVMDGTLISMMRTAAVTGIAAKKLARQDSKLIGVCGAGVISKQQIITLLDIFKHIQEVKIYDLVKSKSIALKMFLEQEYCVNVTVCDSARTAIIDSDIIVTGTTVSAKDAYIEASWIKPGSFLANVSLQDPKEEVILNSDKIVVDDWEHANAENRPLNRLYEKKMISKDDIHAELSEILFGNKSGRENKDEKIFFNPMGLGIEDIACATEIYKIAVAKKIGRAL